MRIAVPARTKAVRTDFFFVFIIITEAVRNKAQR
jgi:hypothetical protein